MTELVDRPVDENLPAAKGRLRDAVSAISDPKPRLVGSRTTYLDPLYTQLADAIVGTTGERSGCRISLPLWVDCLDLKNDIDKQARSWIRYATSTIDRFHKLEAYGWRPQDAALVNTIAHQITVWVGKIEYLLDPPMSKTISAPCPECGSTHVYRKDSSGEQVRQPALQLTTAGCVCQRCKTVWTPDRYMWLCKLLGFELPTGVLE